MSAPTSPTPACAQAMGTPELLENILICLPITELLHAPRVCKQWRDSIQASPRLQQALFLSPMPGGPLQSCGNGTGDRRWAKDETDTHRYTVFANPFYFRHSGQWSKKVRQSDLKKLDRPEASWRRMLVSQPPIKGKGGMDGVRMKDVVTDLDTWFPKRLFQLDRVTGSAQWIEVKNANQVVKNRRKAPDWAPSSSLSQPT